MAGTSYRAWAWAASTVSLLILENAGTTCQEAPRGLGHERTWPQTPLGAWGQPLNTQGATLACGEGKLTFSQKLPHLFQCFGLVLAF